MEEQEAVDQGQDAEENREEEKKEGRSNLEALDSELRRLSRLEQRPRRIYPDIRFGNTINSDGNAHGECLLHRRWSNGRSFVLATYVVGKLLTGNGE